MRSGMKKVQKTVNKYVRRLRDELQKDPLFGGRFDVKQYSASWRKFSNTPDQYEVYLVFELMDKKKDYYHYIYDINCHDPKDDFFDWELREEVNEFIGDILWKENRHVI